MNEVTAQIAGKYTIDVGNDATRVEIAFGSIFNLRDEAGNLRPATTPEIEAAIFDWVEGSTHDYERRQDMASFTPPEFVSTEKYHPDRVEARRTAT